MIAASATAYTITLGGADPLITVASIAITYGGATLSITNAGGTETVLGDVADAGNLRVDTGGAGGSGLAVDGTLTVTGQFDVGGGGLPSASAVTLGAFVNTGGINVVGNFATPADAATVTVGGPAGFGTVGVVTGSVYLDGAGTIAFVGGGQITAVATGSSLELRAGRQIDDAGVTGANTALAGLSVNAGNLAVRYGDSLSLSGNLLNSGNFFLEDQVSSAGQGTTSSIAGTLTNTGQVFFGGGRPSAAGTLIAGAVANTGNLQIAGNGTAAAVMWVGADATDSGDISIGAGGTLAVTGTLAGAVVNGGTALVEAAGTLTIDGSYQQAASATLEEVVPGAIGFGAMTVTGAATLGGTLTVGLQSGAVVAAGETLSVVTAAGGVSGTFAELVYNGATALGTSSLAIGNGLFLNQVYGADAMSLVVSATAAAPPVLTAPGTVVANLGSAAPIGGLAVTVAAVGSVSVTLADVTGERAATVAVGATVAGDNSTQLTLSGAPDAVNTELRQRHGHAARVPAGRHDHRAGDRRRVAEQQHDGRRLDQSAAHHRAAAAGLRAAGRAGSGRRHHRDGPRRGCGGRDADRRDRRHRRRAVRHNVGRRQCRRRRLDAAHADRKSGRPQCRAGDARLPRQRDGHVAGHRQRRARRRGQAPACRSRSARRRA